MFPVSARTGSGVRRWSTLVDLLPPGPFYFSSEQLSDQPESVLLAELVREQVLARTRDEVPHAVEIEIESVDRRRDDLVRIEAVILVETESQKGILIGAGGGWSSRSASPPDGRSSASSVLACISSFVRVRRHWRGDERVLDRLGIE